MIELQKLYQDVLYVCSIHVEPTDRISVDAEQTNVCVTIGFIKNNDLYSAQYTYSTKFDDFNSVKHSLGLMFEEAHERYKND